MYNEPENGYPYSPTSKRWNGVRRLMSTVIMSWWLLADFDRDTLKIECVVQYVFQRHCVHASYPLVLCYHGCKHTLKYIVNSHKRTRSWPFLCADLCNNNNIANSTKTQKCDRDPGLQKVSNSVSFRPLEGGHSDTGFTFIMFMEWHPGCRYSLREMSIHIAKYGCVPKP